MDKCIGIDVFKKIYSSFENNNIPNNLLETKQELLSNFSCFNYSNTKKYSYNKNFKSTSHEIVKPKNSKLHTISANYTEKDNFKKLWIGYLNKLSQKNEEQYSQKIIDLLNDIQCNTIRTELYNSIWDFIKRAPDKVYINVLSLFDFSFTENKWNSFIQNNEWIPNDNIINNNVLSNDKDMYDLYCDYVTWKKHIKNTNIGWILLFTKYQCLNKIDTLLKDIVSLFEKYKLLQKTHKHMIDFALEQIYVILQKYSNQNVLKNIYIQNKDTQLQSSSKFLLMDIFQLLQLDISS